MPILITNALLVTVDDAMTVHEPGWVLIEGGAIRALGGGVPPDTGDAERIDAEGDLVMPGMINPHCHMAMTLFRGLGEDVDDRLFRYILPLERKFVSTETVAIGSRLAALEMIMGGVTTVADMYYFEQEVGRAVDESGMRGVVGQTLADFAPPDHKDFEEGFGRVEELVAAFAGHPRVTASIAPHAPYSTGPDVLRRVTEWSDAHPDVPVQMHLSEMTTELDWAARHFGLRPVGFADTTGIIKPGLIAAHCRYLDAGEIELLAERGVGVAHNARSNGKAGRGFAPVTALRRAGVPVGIATDGPMSGNTLDLFSQFAPASMFQKILGGSRKPLPAADVIRMATIEGARVLGLDGRIGSLEPGKQADLIRLDLSAPRLQPIYDPYSMLVFAAMPGDVRDVMVDGRWLMRERQVLTLERRKILRDALQVAESFNAEIRAIDAGR
ncbi:MAG: amidohydrolase [Devosia sp.]|nr:amidohydrolase [Devosia sp.]